MSFTDEQIIAKYVEIKTARDADEEAWKARHSEKGKMLQALEGLLAARIIQMGKDEKGKDRSISTDSGTAYIRTVVYARVADEEKFKSYVTTHSDMSLVKWNEVDKDGAAAFMEANQGFEPPGVKVTSIRQLIVRR